GVEQFLADAPFLSDEFEDLLIVDLPGEFAPHAPANAAAARPRLPANGDAECRRSTRCRGRDAVALEAVPWRLRSWVGRRLPLIALPPGWFRHGPCSQRHLVGKDSNPDTFQNVRIGILPHEMPPPRTRIRPS